MELTPLLDGPDHRSVILGAPKDFDLLGSLKSATSIRLAIAFGRVSGWEKIKQMLIESTAQSVCILLGQAFFQTDKDILLELKSLRSSEPNKFQVKLAAATVTFHPKVWIIDQGPGSICIVGSANLSLGGLAKNVECGMCTTDLEHAACLRRWFELLWLDAPPFDETCDAYLKHYLKIEADRKHLQKKIEDATREQAANEANWRKKEALLKARQYWGSASGAQDVRKREDEIAKMRSALNFPTFNFDSAGWKTFLENGALGWILFPYKGIDLPSLQRVLLQIEQGSLSLSHAVDELQKIKGVGRNVATKLLAVIAPDKSVVVNGQVEKALTGFGYPIEHGNKIAGNDYLNVMRNLAPFIEECESLGLRCAVALDAFFMAANRP